MIKILKNFIILYFVFFMTIIPANAKEKIKLITNINNEFSISNIQEEVHFKTIKKITILNEITIPQRSIITAEILQAQKERRWHKSGFIVCKLKYYVTEYDQELHDISDKNIYIVARKYEKIDKKEASILATEIVLAQAASFFAPGVDILYFFTKGAIQRKKDPHWFKAGVSNAYDNSICWFWLKGKPIDLEQNAEVQLKGIDENKAIKLKTQIEKRNEKEAIKTTNKSFKTKIKENKKELKAQHKEQFKNNKKYKTVIYSELENQFFEFEQETDFEENDI